MDSVLDHMGQPNLQGPFLWLENDEMKIFHRQVVIGGKTMHFCVARQRGRNPLKGVKWTRYYHHIGHFLFLGTLVNGRPLFS